MTDIDLQFPQYFARAERHLDGVSDPVLLVLKGHLLIEEGLYAALEAKCSEPDLVEQARLTFFQKLQMVRALYGLPEGEKQRRSMEILLDAIEALNTLRNRLAHKLEPEGLGPLLKRIQITTEEDGDLNDKKVINGLQLSLSMMIGYLGGMSDRERKAATP